MATVPVTRTWVAGEVVLASHFNTNIRDVLNFLLARPIFKGRQTVAQTLTTGVATVITFDVEDVDSAGGHSTVSNTGRYTAVYPGWYSTGGGIAYAANATGVRTTGWRINGTAIPSGFTLYAAGMATNSLQEGTRPGMVFLNVNDYLELIGTQTSGGNLNTAVGATGEQPDMVVRWESN